MAYADQLITCLIDSLAHDNGDNKLYRFLLMWKLITTNDENKLKNIVEQMFNVTIPDNEEFETSSGPDITDADLLPYIEVEKFLKILVNGLCSQLNTLQRNIFRL